MSKAKPRTGIEKSYKSRQMESFAYVDTKADEWLACEINSMNQATGECGFDVPDSYKVVAPISSRLPADQLAELHARREATEYGTALCELCGAPVKFPHPIRHNGKKLVMYIGSECVTNYTKEGKKLKQKKKAFKDHLLKEKFRVWLSIAKEDIWTIEKVRDYDNLDPRYQGLMKNLWKAQKEIDGWSATKMRNLFKKAHKLDIHIPIDYIPKE